jgi:hypothetical protein
MVMVNFAFAVGSAIPSKILGGESDGLDMIQLARNPAAVANSLAIMRINGAVSDGILFSAMPREWFEEQDAPYATQLRWMKAEYLNGVGAHDEARAVLRSIDVSHLSKELARSLSVDLPYNRLIYGGEQVPPEEFDTPGARELSNDDEWPPALEAKAALAWYLDHDMAASQEAVGKAERCLSVMRAPNDATAERRNIEALSKWLAADTPHRAS